MNNHFLITYSRATQSKDPLTTNRYCSIYIVIVVNRRCFGFERPLLSFWWWHSIVFCCRVSTRWPILLTTDRTSWMVSMNSWTAASSFHPQMWRAKTSWRRWRTSRSRCCARGRKESSKGTTPHLEWSWTTKVLCRVANKPLFQAKSSVSRLEGGTSRSISPVTQRRRDP